MISSRARHARKYLLIGVLLTLVGAGCQAPAATNVDERPVVQFVSDSGDLPADGSLQLRVRVSGHDPRAVTWTSSDPRVATVSPSGLVVATDTAQPASVVQITATSEVDPSVTDTVDVAVVASTEDAVRLEAASPDPSALRSAAPADAEPPLGAEAEVTEAPAASIAVAPAPEAADRPDGSEAEAPPLAASVEPPAEEPAAPDDASPAEADAAAEAAVPDDAAPPEPAPAEAAPPEPAPPEAEPDAPVAEDVRADAEPVDEETSADAESADAEPADAETADAEPADAEPADAETADAEPADAETADAGPADAEASVDAEPAAADAAAAAESDAPADGAGDGAAETAEGGEADAQAIFVDADAGTDGDGTEGAPFASISAGIEAAPPGGTVRVLPGTYEENLSIRESVSVVGEGEVTVRAGGADGAEQPGAIDVFGASDVVLEGFTLEMVGEGPGTAAIAVYGGADGVTIRDVQVEHTAAPSLHGINVDDSTNVRLEGVSVTADPSAGASGAGIRVSGASSGITLADVRTEGHVNYAGVVLAPGGEAMADVAVSGRFAEEDPLTAILTGDGSLTGLRAPQFTHVVRNLHPGDGSAGLYGSGDWWFYREDEATAVGGALFGFGRDAFFADAAGALGYAPDGGNPTASGAASVVHVLDSEDQSVLGDEIVVGEAGGEAYGYGTTRSSNVQVALDQASALEGVSTVLVRPGRYRGHAGAITVPEGVTVVGASPEESIFVADVADPESVITGPGADAVSGVGAETAGAP